MDDLLFNDKKVALAFETEEIRRNEPEFFVKHVAKMSGYSTLCSRTLTAADKIARSLTYITALYAEATKRVNGGWTCGTHVNHVRAALAHQIASLYDDAQLCSFIDFSVDCADGRKSLQNADNDIKGMVEEFLAMRPAPFVHPPFSWWRQVLKDEN